MGTEISAEMIERVARAIFYVATRGYDISWDVMKKPVNEAEKIKGLYRHMARDAIEAMREPTGE